MIERLVVAIAALATTIGLSLAVPVRADDGPYPRPVPPDIVKMIETPAKVFADASVVHFDGVIADEAVYEVERQLQAAGNNPIHSLVIKSGGGEGNAGIRFGEIVRDWKLSVTVDRRCMSSCANYVALAARELYVPDGAALGFHGGVAKTWGEDGQYLESQKALLRSIGIEDRFFPALVEADKITFARQQALFDSVGVSSAILTDTGRGSGTTLKDLWMFTQDALERCYNVKNIKQYPVLSGDMVPNGKSFLKIVRDCPRKAQ